MPQITQNGKMPTLDDNLLSLSQLKSSNSHPNNSPSEDDWSHATKELLDSLPRVWTRGLLYFLVLFIGIVLPWTILAKVDETGTARGRLEPKGKTIRLDAPVEGTVAKIMVKEGDTVKANQTLIELESELIKTELQQQKNKLEGQQNRLNQLELLYNQLELTFNIQQQQNQAQALEKEAQVNQARENLDSLRNSYNLQKAEKLSQVQQAQQNLEHSKKANKLVKGNLDNAEKQLQIYQKALEDEIVSKIQIIDKQDALQERKKSYEQSKSDTKQAQLRLLEQNSSYQRTMRQANTDIEQAQLKLKEQESSYRSLIRSGQLAGFKIQEQLQNLTTDITTLKAEIAQTKNQIESLEFQLSQRVLKSPIDGRVFQLPIQRPGAVLQPSNMVAEIAPQGSFLILKAQIDTTNSGFLKQGMLVKMKFDAYPFQDYGIVEGKLNVISPTSRVTDTQQGKVTSYDLEISLNKTCLPTPKECIDLHPGDTATAEVIVRQRRIIDFILDPFKKLQQGGFKL
jgi:HlyD family secretion protein